MLMEERSEIAEDILGRLASELADKVDDVLYAFGKGSWYRLKHQPEGWLQKRLDSLECAHRAFRDAERKKEK